MGLTLNNRNGATIPARIDLSRIRLCRKEIEEMYDQNSKNVSKYMVK